MLNNVVISLWTWARLLLSSPFLPSTTWVTGAYPSCCWETVGYTQGRWPACSRFTHSHLRYSVNLWSMFLNSERKLRARQNPHMHKENTQEPSRDFNRGLLAVRWECKPWHHREQLVKTEKCSLILICQVKEMKCPSDKSDTEDSILRRI